MKKPSISDVARKAGVSTALVSYVLNGQMEGRISKEAIEKVRAAVSELNYRPNRIAQSLKLNKTSTIGLIVADIANPFSSYLSKIIEEEAQKKQYSLIIGSSNEELGKSEKLIELFLNRQVDGFIIAPVENSQDQIKELIRQKIPFVLIDRYFDELKTNSVCLNNFQSSQSATAHLISRGKASIGIVSYQTEMPHLNQRVEGFKEGLLQNGISLNPAMIKTVPGAHLDTEVNGVVKSLLEEGADSILFTSNKLAIAGLKSLIEQNARVPEDVAVVSFDETDAFDLFYSPLTYIRQPLKEMGNKAVELLLQNLQDPEIARERHVFEGELVLRKST